MIVDMAAFCLYVHAGCACEHSGAGRDNPLEATVLAVVEPCGIRGRSNNPVLRNGSAGSNAVVGTGSEGACGAAALATI